MADVLARRKSRRPRPSWAWTDARELSCAGWCLCVRAVPGGLYVVHLDYGRPEPGSHPSLRKAKAAALEAYRRRRREAIAWRRWQNGLAVAALGRALAAAKVFRKECDRA